MFKMFAIVGYTFNIINIIKIYITKFIFIAFNKLIYPLFSNKFIYEF